MTPHEVQVLRTTGDNVFRTDSDLAVAWREAARRYRAKKRVALAAWLERGADILDPPHREGGTRTEP